MPHSYSDNSDLEAKTLVRQWALEQAGGKSAKVLELYGGSGHMHDACYSKVSKHLAFDLKPVSRGTWLQGNNRVLLLDNVQGWSLYDADAYGNPWLVLTDVCRLRTPGKFTMVATCGALRPLRIGNPDKFFRWASGYSARSHCGLLHRFYDDFILSVFSMWADFGVQLTANKRIHSRSSQFVYYHAMTAVKTASKT